MTRSTATGGPSKLPAPSTASSTAVPPAERPQMPRSGEVRFYPGDNSAHAERMADQMEAQFLQDPNHNLKVHTTTAWATGVPRIARSGKAYQVTFSTYGYREVRHETDELSEALEYAADKYSYTDEEYEEAAQNEEY